jgi:hypothetical protein
MREVSDGPRGHRADPQQPVRDSFLSIRSVLAEVGKDRPRITNVLMALRYGAER